MHRHTTIYLLLIFLFPLTLCAQFGQETRVKDNSPYSRLGLGDLFNQNFATIRSMGRLSAAYNDPLQLNLVNPASLGFLEAASFEIGMFAEYSKLEDASNNVDVWSGNLGYLSLGFNTKNRLNQILDKKVNPWSWGMNFSLAPFSEVNYGVQLNSTTDDGTLVVNRFNGTGGTYRFMWGNAFRYKQLSVGLNLGYIFGKIDNERILTLSTSPAYGVVTQKATSLNGFSWNIGTQYNVIFKKKTGDGKVPTGKRLTLGAYGNSATGLNTNSSLLEYRSNNTFVNLDTITNRTDLRQKGRLPAQFGIGAMFSDANKWKLGANLVTTQWSNYFNEGLADGQDLNNTWEFSLGGEITPDYKSYNSYLKKIRYRAGAFFGKDPRLNLSNYGVTFGLGLPIILPRQTTSFMNFSFELGRLEDLSSSAPANQIKETYVNLTAGFSLNDNSWFFKRKFN